MNKPPETAPAGHCRRTEIELFRQKPIFQPCEAEAALSNLAPPPPAIAVNVMPLPDAAYSMMSSMELLREDLNPLSNGTQINLTFTVKLSYHSSDTRGRAHSV